MSIFDIGINDTLQNVIRKCNYNFRQINTSQQKQNQIIDSEITVDISGIVDSINNETIARTNADNVIHEKLDQIIFDSSGKLDSSILPSYVDDVIEVYPRSEATELSANWFSLTLNGSAITPETGKIYILMANSLNYDANTQFRWSGNAYVKLTEGQTVSIEVGTTTTLSPGSNATVVNSGTSSSPILDFGIPQGIQGPKGDTGNTGPQGPKGDTGGVPDGGTTDQVLVKASNTDQDIEWKTLNYVTLQAVYPVGAIYMSTVATDPATLFGFGTWERIAGKFLLGATDNGSSGASQAAGNTGGAATVTLTAAQSGVPAHSHGLNSHKHKYDKANSSVTGGSHNHKLSSNGRALITTNSRWLFYKFANTASHWKEDYWLGHGSNIYGGNTGLTDHNTGTILEGYTDTTSSHSHTLAYTSTDSGAASGNTANNTAADASSAHENMPPYLSVYVWKRTA